MKKTDALAKFDKAIYKYAHQWMRYPSVAQEYELEDLAQIGRLYILRALEEFNPHAGMKLSTYIIQRIRWGLNTSLRSIMPKAKRETKHISIDALNEEHGDQWNPIYWEDFKNNEESFDDLIHSLSNEEQRILRMRFVDELTLEQIGYEEGKSHEWARITILKALGKVEN